YHFKISVVGVDYDQNIFAEKDIKTFDSWLSVGDISNQKIDYNGKSYDATVISYYDTIGNFKFDSSKKAISFSMPFNWDTNRIQGQNIFVHQELRIPKAFKDFADSTAFQGSVNGVPTVGRMLILDPYSIEGTSILHFLVNKDDILNIAKKIPSGTKTMDFEVSPTIAVPKTSYDVKLSSGAKANISFDSNLGSSDTIPIHFTFFDKDGKILKYVRYIYAIDDSSGKNLVTNLGPDPQKIGIFTTEGIDVQDYKFSKDGSYVIHLGIISHGLDEQTVFATQSPSSTTINIGKGGQVPPTQQTCPADQVLKDGKCVANTKPTDTAPKSSDVVIPSWIKNNAKYWSGNKITDKDFVNGIQYLIKQKVIKIPDTKKEGTTSTAIPSWVKNTAGFWADGKTSDSDFVKGIQYLIKSGIIKI
ncbi:MAG TPA: peptidase, partial [Candidatus Nitrosotenuis sp.]|nr:peptidase [Candidatus Nitrosotenuis sp.]